LVKKTFQPPLSIGSLLARRCTTAVPGIDLYSIGPNDFAQSLGYPGQRDHPEVVKAKQEITRRFHQAGRRMQADVMKVGRSQRHAA
jgi:4-hydroxy-2-oxoheptanedioate aldolase